MSVFISYSHDSEAHCERVLGLSERLRDDGFETRLDRYVNGTPLVGWQRWMRNQINEAKYVLVVCTETYYRRFCRDEVPEREFGVDWEGMLVTTELYNAKSKTTRFVPVLFDPADAIFIPEPLRGATHYTLTSEANYESLKDFLDQVTGVEPRLSFDSPSDKPRIFHLPQSRNPLFVGREALLKQLDDTVRNEGPTALVQVVAGIGGVGKTQLAVEYAYRNQYRYDVVWSIRCEQPSTLASDYAALAEPLDLPEKAEPDQGTVVGAVRRWLESNRRWLLVMDNVVNPDDVNPYLPQNPTGDIIITSRNQNWHGRARMLSVEKFAREESLDMLLGVGERPPAELASAGALAEALGDLPLALSQVAAYIEATGTTIDNYVNLFRKRRSDVWKHESPFQTTLVVTISLVKKLLRAENEPALHLLNLCSLLAPDDIPRELLASAVANPLDFEDQLAVLRRYSLINVIDGSVSIHRLVQTICRDSWSEAERLNLAASSANLLYSVWPVDIQNDPTTWPYCARLTPHTRAVLSHAADSETTSALWNSLGAYLFTQAAFDDAKAAYSNSVRIAESVFGPDSVELANRLNNLAALLKAANRLAEAEPLMLRALRIEEQTYGSMHPNVAVRLSNLASLLKATNHLADAEPLIRRALAIEVQSYGSEHPYVARSLNNLAQLLLATNRLKDAEIFMRRALEIDERSYGPHHPNVANGLGNLAVLLQRTGRISEAEPLMRHALEIDLHIFGDDHPRIAAQLNNLAHLLQATNRLEEAEPYMRKGLAIVEQSYGPQHPIVATSLNNLAQLLQDTNRLTEAEPLMRRALYIDEQSFGADHPQVAIRLNNLAALLHVTDRLPEAEPLMYRALDIDERAFGQTHPNVAIRLCNLAELLKSKGRLDDASVLIHRAQTIDIEAGRQVAAAREVTPDSQRNPKVPL